MDTLPALPSHRILDDTMALLQTYIPLHAAGYRCATASVLTRAARVTLAVVFVQPGATMGAIVDQLLTAIEACRITIRCLYADKGVCSVAVLARLQRDAIPAMIAMPRRGPQLRALCTGQESHWASHRLQSAADGAVTVKVAVVRAYPRTRQPRRRATWCVFVCLGIRDSLIGIRHATGNGLALRAPIGS
jgi:hypothetical protein